MEKCANEDDDMSQRTYHFSIDFFFPFTMHPLARPSRPRASRVRPARHAVSRAGNCRLMLVGAVVWVDRSSLIIDKASLPSPIP